MTGTNQVSPGFWPLAPLRDPCGEAHELSTHAREHVHPRACGRRLQQKERLHQDRFGPDLSTEKIRRLVCRQPKRVYIYTDHQNTDVKL